MVLDPEKPPEPTIRQKLLAEFAGTFFLTFVAAGGDICDAAFGGTIGHVARYLAPGFLVLAMIWALSGISGAHINPAVTLAFVLRRHFPIPLAARYWIVQFAGAIAAAGVLRGFFGSLAARGATVPGPAISNLQAAGWEALITALLITVILATTEQKAVVGKNSALAVGFTVALCGLFSSPVSGASMNPARSLGPQLVSGDLQYFWIYLAGPIAGAGIAVLLAGALLGTLPVDAVESASGEREESGQNELITSSR